MSNFSKVIDYLSTLSSHQRGKIFERYCKWFLENDPRYAIQLKKVWLWQDWPENWGRDKGIDLIAETRCGKLWAIQVKAYDEAYYITKEDVDKFISESSRKEISFRLLIATTNNLGPNAQEVILAQEKLMGICLLNQLETSVLDWDCVLTNSSASYKKKAFVPYPHQERALLDILAGFKNSDHGQLYMACGTGKTLVGLWLAERLQSNTTLVLVPSISLVSQLYLEWANNHSNLFNFYPIFVCSDQTVGDKEENTDYHLDENINLGFPVTTCSMELLNELSSGAGHKVIFSTYHSSPVIKKACEQDASLTFDLVIADEAHRCAGQATSDFATVVNKDAIRAKHKLFMTATPKIFSDNVKSKTQEFGYEIASMDDEEKFGPVFHRLPFSAAIKEKLLSDYQVVISVMN
ncbi:MAG: DEAD/DEAH box helicase family protein, partial [Candidatus Babeliales bacterium]